MGAKFSVWVLTKLSFLDDGSRLYGRNVCLASSDPGRQKENGRVSEKGLRARVHQGRGRSPRPHDGRRLQEEHGRLLELAGWKAARLKNKDLKKQRQEKQRQRQENKKKKKRRTKTKTRKTKTKARKKVCALEFTKAVGVHLDPMTADDFRKSMDACWNWLDGKPLV